jgi:phosphatidylserine synthase
MIAGRAAAGGLALALTAGIVLILLDKPLEALALTVTAGVAIINGLWLERLLVKVLQPGRPRVSRSAVVLLLVRFGLWGLLFAAVYAVREWIELWAVAVGLGCFLVALAVAGAGAREG